MKPLESDWKVFHRLVPSWRERYLDIKNKEIAQILIEPGKTSTERFWQAKEKLDAEEKILRESLDGHSRLKMEIYLLIMMRCGMLQEVDLSPFSEQLRERIGGWRTGNA